MVSTRRQSARLQVAPLPPKQDIVEHTDESDLSSLDESEGDDNDSGSEYEDNRIQTQSGRPSPAKRAKIAAKKDITTSKDSKTKPKKSVQKKNASKLSLLPTMPLDILFEIFGHVSPTDLLNLLRVNAALCSTLIGRNGTAVWKAARKTYHDAPDPPEDFTEARWASLLFGRRCQECDSHHYVQIDFALRRRLCSKCKKSQLISLSRFSVHFPFHDKSILELIPHTNAAEINLAFAGRTTKYYWEADIYDISKKLGKFDSDVSLRKPAAKQNLQAFREQRSAFVENVLTHATKCRKWIKHLDAVKEAEEKEKGNARYEDIKARFVELGYNPADIQSALSHNTIVHKSTRLTNAVWNRISGELEVEIKRARLSRLEREHQDLMNARRNVVRELYSEYHRTLLPSEWVYMPPIEVVYDFPGIKALLSAEDNVSITAESFGDEVSALPGTISGWAEAKRVLLRASLEDRMKPEPLDPAQPGPSGGNKLTSTSTAGPSQIVEDRLALATAVFTCPSGYNCIDRNAPLISCEGIFRHRCRDPYAFSYFPNSTSTMLTPVLSLKGSQAAASVVKLAGLDVRRATPREMDHLDRRFVCVGCKPGQHGSYWGFMTLTWRQCIVHATQISYRCSNSDNFRILTPEEERTSRTKTLPQSSYTSNADLEAWSCAHCSVHFEDWGTQLNVIGHVQNNHGIADPKVYYDLIVRPGVQYSKVVPHIAEILEASKPMRLGVRLGMVYNCVHCQQDVIRRKNRLFQLQGVRSHIQDVHKIKEPAQTLGVDYKIAS